MLKKSYTLNIDNCLLPSSFGRASIQVRHKQKWGQGFILLIPKAAVLPGSDDGSDVVKSASSSVIKNPSDLVLYVVPGAPSIICPLRSAEAKSGKVV